LDRPRQAALIRGPLVAEDERVNALPPAQLIAPRPGGSLIDAILVGEDHTVDVSCLLNLWRGHTARNLAAIDIAVA
jgi:hypothetical protein